MSQKGSCPSPSPFMACDISTDIYRDILGLDIGFTNKHRVRMRIYKFGGFGTGFCMGHGKTL